MITLSSYTFTKGSAKGIILTYAYDRLLTAVILKHSRFFCMSTPGSLFVCSIAETRSLDLVKYFRCFNQELKKKVLDLQRKLKNAQKQVGILKQEVQTQKNDRRHPAENQARIIKYLKRVCTNGLIYYQFKAYTLSYSAEFKINFY